LYLCICNGLNEKRVRAAVEQEGAASVAGVYRACGVLPRCGKCREAIREFVQAKRTAECHRIMDAAIMVAAE
jgi:bacterioferritin-associated ferredoxin